MSKSPSYKPIKSDDLKKFLMGIQKQCSEILSVYREVPGRYLYRGFSSNPTAYFLKGVSPTNRMPTDMSYTVHSKLVHLFNKLGIKANRSNSIFCTTHGITAQGHGPVYIIFPINGFNYSWSRMAIDLFTAIETKGPFHIKFRDRMDIDDPRSVEEIQSKFQFTDNDLELALQTYHEILINGSYYAVRLSYVSYIAGDGIHKLKTFIETGEVPE